MLLFCIWLVSPIFSNDISLNDNRYFIAHACGEIDGHDYTNSQEAILRSLAKGYKYIEIDLGLTKDSILVCYHDVRQFNEMTNMPKDSLDIIPTKEEFINRRIAGRYTPMTFEQAKAIWEKDSFILVIDKISDPKILNKYIKKNRHYVMVEAFSLEDYFILKRDGYVPMLSLGALSLRGECGLYNFFKKRRLIGMNIDWVVLDINRSNHIIIRIFKRLFGIKVAMYSSNSTDYFTKHLGREVDLIYTDKWKRQEIKQ